MPKGFHHLPIVAMDRGMAFTNTGLGRHLRSNDDILLPAVWPAWVQHIPAHHLGDLKLGYEDLGVFLSVTEEVGFGGSQTLKLCPIINIQILITFHWSECISEGGDIFDLCSDKE